MQRPPPEVTVTDPRRPGPLVPAEEPVPLRLGRRGTAALAAAVVVGASALFAADVARDREDAAEQRRLDGVVELALGAPSGGWSSSHDLRSGTGTVAGVVRLLNHGPRDVRVTSAELGSLRLPRAVQLPTGGDGAALQLRRTVPCPGGGTPPPLEPEPRRLRVSLETPAGPRQVSLDDSGLPIGSLNEAVQHACLFPPLGESLHIASTVVRLEDRTAVLEVTLANEGRRPVRLLSLVPARGLVVQSVGGDSTGLPLNLPVRTGRFPPERTLELRLAVICGALLGADLLRPFEELAAIIEDEGREQITSVVSLSRDPDLQLRQLARRTCASG